MCFNFNKVQATESVFSNINLTRANLQAVAQANTLSTTTTSKVLGISKNRESGNWYVWNPKADAIDENGNLIVDENGNVQAQKVWKIAAYPSTTSNIPSYNDLYYCLNASKGFGLSNGEMAEGAKDTYNVSYDMKDSNDKNSIISASEGNLGTNYNKILWILDNSYIPTKNNLYKTSDEYINLMKKAEIEIENKDWDLTEDDIEVVQQMAIWYFTNNTGYTTLPSLYINGKQLSSIYYGTDEYGQQITGAKRQAKANKLYQYFINNASSSYSPVTPTLSLSATDAVEESGDYYVAGPFSLTKENVSISELEVKLNNTTLSSGNYLIVSSKTSTTNITDYNSLNTFYLKLPKAQITSNQTTINVMISGTYNTKTLTFMTNEDETNQPVVLIKNEQNNITDNANVNINLTEVSVEKIWNDNDNQDGVRPQSVKVQLYKDGKAYGNSITLSGTALTYTWDRLLDGYTYTVKELNSNNIAVENNQKYNADYTASYVINGNKTTITNTHIPETINISGIKTWNDSNNQDRKRPASITVNLLANGTEINEVVVTEANNWAYSFTNLPKYKNGIEIKYTITEDAVVDYTTEINGYNITNTYTPGIVEKTVTKIWEDGNDSDGIRTTSVEVQLYKTVNGIKTSMGEDYKVALNKGNGWKYTWNNLPEKEDGNIITYTVEEVDVPNGYSVSYSEDTFTITNTHVPKDLAIQLQKIDEQGNIITSSEATFEIAGTQNVTNTTNGGILDLDSQKLLSNNFEFTYTIKETNAPIGYNEVDGELSVKIAGTTKLENGSYVIDTIEITDKDGNPLDNTKIIANYDSELNKVIIKIVNTKKTNEYTVQLLKVGEDGTTPISGAWFKINDGQATLISETGHKIAKGTLSENGELNLTYKLEETVSPDGYIKIDGAKEVKINAKVELKENEYQITEVNLTNELEGITISEENNVITIKVKNEVEITGKYNVVLRKVDENGNILTGAKFEVDGTEYELSTGEVTLLENKDLTSTNNIDLTYTLKETGVPEGYEGIEDTTIYINAKVIKDGNSYKITRVNGTFDGDNAHESVPVTLEGNTIVITVKNTPIQKKFDLSLRKFITKVNDIEYSREPVVDTSTIATTGTATYKHIKQPIPVQKGDVVTYTIRVYNEGELDGYVETITDHLPDNLLPILSTVDTIDAEKYAEEIKFNEDRLWQQIDNEKTVFTTITSKNNSDLYSEYTKLENITDTKLDAYVEASNKLDYIDVQIKCLVTDKAVSGEYLTNIAEITDSQDINGVQGDGSDSELSNAYISNLADYKNQEAITSTEDSYIPGQEDDDDFEKLVVKEFDLALRKFIIKVNETSYSRQPVVDASKLGTIDENGRIITDVIYNHSKEPVIVETNDIVTYTIRIYNEGSLAGYANEITDDIPEGLEFLPNSSVNVSYKWRMLDSEGNETEDVSKAVMIVTDYLSDSDKNNIINAVSENDGVKTLSYKDVEVQFKVIAKAEKSKDNVIKNVAQISADSDRDIDSTPNRDEKYDYTTGNNEDDIDYEPIKLQYFDLALRKFITKVNTTEYNNRYPEITYNEDGSITYKHTKDPVLVTTNDVVIYTIRVYNEGEKAGYATEITDNLPEGLEFLPENEVNKQYGWKLIDSEGNETQDITKAVKFTTDCLKDELIDNLVVENGQKILSYKDVQIAFKVIEPNTSDRILVNTAEISADSDDDIDSIPGNNILEEDDIDREYVKVQYFDLSLKKWVTKTMVTYDGKTTTTNTGFTEDSDDIAKVDLVASKMKKTTVKFAYNIKVTNEGELPGYAYEVKDYIPKGLKFVAEDNKDWKEIKDGVVVTEKLKDTLLNPGESATVEIVLTWQNSTTNTGLKTNYAEISKDSADDIDSIPDNYNLKEDDIDDAQVILSIKTAGSQTYVGLILLSVAILAGGIFLIKKYVIKE